MRGLGSTERKHSYRYVWILLLLAVLVAPGMVLAQATFERTYGGILGDHGNSVQQTSDAGYIIVGWTESFGAVGGDVYLIRTDSLGNILWDSTYGGDSYDCGLCVQKTSDGGYVVVGETQSFGAGYYDIYLLKTDSLGKVIWEKTFGDSLYESGYSVRQTQDGGYICTGYTGSTGAGELDAYLIKTDSSGNALWDMTYGGSGIDRGSSVQQTWDGGYIIAGVTESYGAGSYDVYLVRTDSVGNSLWQTTYGNSEEDWAFSVQQTLDGGYVVAGRTDPLGTHLCDAYLVKVDSIGNAVWEASYGDSLDDGAWSVQQTTDGGYVVAGWKNSVGTDSYDVYLVKTDGAGDSLWTRVFGGSDLDLGLSVQECLDGGYVIAGYTESFGEGSGDVYLIKTDENGLTGIEETGGESSVLRRSFQLIQNSPNPFRLSTSISYTLPVATQVTLSIYDITGRLVETLVNENQQPGIHQVNWNREDNPSGVYFYRLEAGEFVETRKMVGVE